MASYIFKVSFQRPDKTIGGNLSVVKSKAVLTQHYKKLGYKLLRVSQAWKDDVRYSEQHKIPIVEIGQGKFADVDLGSHSLGIPDKETLTNLRKMYPAGTRIRLLYMDDLQAPPTETLGTVQGVDDIGNIMVAWDSGSSLHIVPAVDEFEIVE